MLLKSKFFWIITAIFLLACLGAAWKLYPPVLKEFGALRDQEKKLQDDTKKAEYYNQSVKKLKENADSLDKVYLNATHALPVTPKNDLLLLEIEGLTNSIGLSNVAISVPFQGSVAQASPSSQSASSGGDDSVKRGSTANTKPIVKGTSTDTTSVTISGNIDFSKAKELVSKLQSFSRWNKVKSVDITKSSDTYATTITIEVFTRPLPTAGFTDTSSTFLKTAQDLFTPLKTYTSEPDATTEGNYGKPNPFN